MRGLPPLFGLLLGACGAEVAPADPPAPEAEVVSATVEPADRGAVVFATTCAPCHGPEGRGGAAAGEALDPPAPALVGPRPAHLRGIPRRQIIEEGRPGTAMIAWKGVLTPEQLDDVYAYVHAMQHGPGSPMGGGRGPRGGMP